jgi:hypothetical protein
MKKIFFYFFILGSVVNFVGCPNSGSNPTNSNPVTLGSTVQPKVGSTFTFTTVSLDSNGNAISGSATTTVDSVVETGITYSGKTNVMHVASGVPGVYSTDNYYSYESNGDISVNFPNAAPLPPWLSLPFHSSGATVQILVDSMIGQSRLVEGDSVVTLGTFNTTVNGMVLPTVKLKMTVFLQTTAGGITSSSSLLTTYYSIAPSIGYFTELLLPSNHISGNGSDQTLISFRLK